MAEPKFEIFKDTRDEFRFRLVAPNGEIIAASQGYDAKSSCLEGIASVEHNAVSARVIDLTSVEEGGVGPKFEIFKDTRDEFRFRLVAPNGEIIAASQGYDAKASCVAGIESVRRNAPIAVLVDTTPTRGVVQRVKRGLAWLLMFRLVRSAYFRGSWWRDVLTGSERRDELPDEPE